MVSREKLLKSPNYLLAKYQAEIYRQLTDYMRRHDLTQKDVAKRLGVTTSYVNQILRGDFNYTLKKLIEISLFMEQVPEIQFISFKDYWEGADKKREEKGFEAVTQPGKNRASKGTRSTREPATTPS